MGFKRRKWWLVVGVLASLLAASVAAAAMGVDFGVQTEKKLAHKSQLLFGVRVGAALVVVDRIRHLRPRRSPIR